MSGGGDVARHVSVRPHQDSTPFGPRVILQRNGGTPEGLKPSRWSPTGEQLPRCRGQRFVLPGCGVGFELGP